MLWPARIRKLMSEYPDIKLEVIIDCGLTDIVAEQVDAGVRFGETATVWSRRSPAGVGDTLRVVRFSRRMPSRVSKPLIVWLSADCDTPSLTAAG